VSGANPAPDSGRRELVVMRPLFAAGFVTAFGAHSIAATLGLGPDLAEHLLALGVLLALYDGAEVLLKPAFGALADRIGPRPVLVGCSASPWPRPGSCSPPTSLSRSAWRDWRRARARPRSPRRPAP